MIGKVYYAEHLFHSGSFRGFSSRPQWTLPLGVQQASHGPSHSVASPHQHTAHHTVWPGRSGAVSGLTSCFASHVATGASEQVRLPPPSVDCFRDCSNTPTQSGCGGAKSPPAPILRPRRPLRDQGPRRTPPSRRNRRVAPRRPRAGKTARRGRPAAFRVGARDRQHLSLPPGGTRQPRRPAPETDTRETRATRAADTSRPDGANRRATDR